MEERFAIQDQPHTVQLIETQVFRKVWRHPSEHRLSPGTPSGIRSP